MTVVQWPNLLPQKVLREAWGFTPVSPLRRTEMDDGSIALSRRHHRVRTLVSVSWDMTPAQFELLRNFWDDDLDAGQRWFWGPVFEGLRSRLNECRFSGDQPFQASSPAAGRFRVSAQMELREMPKLTPEERAGVELWLGNPELVNDIGTLIDEMIAQLEAL